VVYTLKLDLDTADISPPRTFESYIQRGIIMAALLEPIYIYIYVKFYGGVTLITLWHPALKHYEHASGSQLFETRAPLRNFDFRTWTTTDTLTWKVAECGCLCAYILKK